jgi:hypothetical protein
MIRIDEFSLAIVRHLNGDLRLNRGELILDCQPHVLTPCDV